jgi:phosphopantetheine adenylyltransferase
MRKSPGKSWSAKLARQKRRETMNQRRPAESYERTTVIFGDEEKAKSFTKEMAKTVAFAKDSGLKKEDVSKIIKGFRNKVGFNYYKEIVGNYRKIASEIDVNKIATYLKSFKYGSGIMKTILREVF